MNRQEFVRGYLGPIDIEKGERKTGLIAWIFVGLFVLIWDIWAIRNQKVETLTRSFWRLSKTSYGGFLLQSLWGILTVHLLIEARLRQALEGRRNNKAQ